MSERGTRRSPWGEDDQRGATNLLTPELVLAALGSVRQGRIVDLSHEIKVGHPRIDPFIGPYQIGMWATPATTRRVAREHLGAENDPGVFTERVELCMHTGTHIDALGHFTIGDEMFNGWHYQSSSNDWGLERLGIEQAPPMVSRGVLLDVAGRDGGDCLEGGKVVGVADLKKALERAGTELRPGDVVLIRTGWGRYFAENPDQYVASEPGIDEEAARWLTEQQVCAIGCDNMAVEVSPNPDPKVFFPVHQHTLVEAGVHLIENLTFDGLMETGASTFCFVLLPVKFTGATGCPVRPVAIL